MSQQGLPPWIIAAAILRPHGGSSGGPSRDDDDLKYLIAFLLTPLLTLVLILGAILAWKECWRLKAGWIIEKSIEPAYSTTYKNVTTDHPETYQIWICSENESDKVRLPKDVFDTVEVGMWYDTKTKSFWWVPAGQAPNQARPVPLPKQ